MFANLNGTISAWNPALGASAFIQATTPGAVYTGLSLFSPPPALSSQPLLYAANNAGSGSINVFNSNFVPASGLAANAFATPAAISAQGLVPFNVQILNGFVYVTYAPSGRIAQQNAPLGAGALAVFNLDGSSGPNMTMIGGHLAAPWGLAIAPSAFGPFAGDLFVGNFSYINSGINIFDPTGTWEGTILIDPGSGNTAGGLWALGVGTGPNNGSPDTLFFTDGINGERDGLFGSLNFATNGLPPVTAVPELSTWAMMLLGFAGLAFAFHRSKRKPSFA
jgi:uncharacterized protein (TIGR03118 family)